MSTISNDVLEKLSVRYRLLAKIHDGSESQAWEESALIVEELLALRKERERAEPDYYVVVTSVGVWQSFHRNRAEAEFIVNKPFHHGYSVLEIYTAPPAPVLVDDSLPFDPQIAEYEQMMEAELKAAAEMEHKPKSELSQMAEKLVRDTTALAEKLSAEADTTSQQFESLAGKAVGGSEGFECTPVADLYELLTKCGECYDYTTSAKVAADWIKEGYSAREYVKLDRLQEAMTHGSSGEPDGWIPCSERMPDTYVNVLLTDEHGDTCIGQLESFEDAHFYISSSIHRYKATHWQPLPEPPCK